MGRERAGIDFMPKRKVKAKRNYTPEQRAAMRERMMKARAHRKGNHAREITSTESIPGRELRPSVGEEAPLRQQGEAASESQTEAGTNGTAQEALKLSAFGTPPSCDSPEQRKMLVYRLLQNDRMLLARSSGEGIDRHVWVGDNRNFVPGMPLNAVPHPAEPAFWKLVGALPQVKGRW